MKHSRGAHDRALCFKLRQTNILAQDSLAGARPPVADSCLALADQKDLVVALGRIIWVTGLTHSPVDVWARLVLSPKGRGARVILSNVWLLFVAPGKETKATGVEKSVEVR